MITRKSSTIRAPYAQFPSKSPILLVRNLSLHAQSAKWVTSVACDKRLTSKRHHRKRNTSRVWPLLHLACRIIWTVRRITRYPSNSFVRTRAASTCASSCRRAVALLHRSKRTKGKQIRLKKRSMLRSWWTCSIYPFSTTPNTRSSKHAPTADRAKKPTCAFRSTGPMRMEKMTIAISWMSSCTTTTSRSKRRIKLTTKV